MKEGKRQLNLAGSPFLDVVYEPGLFEGGIGTTEVILITIGVIVIIAIAIWFIKKYKR